MIAFFSRDRLRFLLSRTRERLWIKPLAVCLLSIAVAFIAKVADDTLLERLLPTLAAESLETLLSIMAASMLVIATFSVAAMVSAYASAGTTATPRAFRLIVADDVSKNALSTFVGAFIFSVVALVAVKNEYYGKAGLFILFVITVLVFAQVIVTFVRWVDRIARLGRLGTTIDTVEKATANALRKRRDAPTLCGLPASGEARGKALAAERVGYVQHIDVAALQKWAEEAQATIRVASLPGTFAFPGRALVYVATSAAPDDKVDYSAVLAAITIGDERLYDDDPRFGLVVLSEIACRALSPAVNDPGTAIGILGTLLRLLTIWSAPATQRDKPLPQYDRVEVPELSVRDMLDDAFMAIGRDGAGLVEVSVRLQKTLHALRGFDDPQLRAAAEHHSRLALKRSEHALDIDEDLAAIREARG